MELKKVHELINKEASHFNISLPTPTNHQKILASDAMELLKSEEIDLLQKAHEPLEKYCGSLLSKAITDRSFKGTQ